jgi:2-polyprenyl-3-methyl-5-hydroxy-6-metoxy-1,4-benzoquinol methylase
MDTTVMPGVAAAPDPAKLDAFVGRFLGELGATMSAAAVLVGERLGLWRALAEGGPADSTALARRTGTGERSVREWLAAQAAAGYLDYDPQSGLYALPPEQAAVLADEASPVYLMGFFDIAAAAWRDEPKITESFRTGRGVGWHERQRCLFCGTERFFRTSYNHQLVQNWLPALDGVVKKLERGATVADVGCGHGASTVIMARAFPNSRFTGFDYHAPSIAAAREAAAAAGVSDRCTFEVAAAKEVPARGYDLVCCFDCLHDMGDPAGAAAHLRNTLRPDGTWMVVEPFARDRVEENLNPVGRVYYAASTMICVPASIAQGPAPNGTDGAALGAQAGPKRLEAVMRQGGFTRVRVAAETPFNLVIEARP